MTEERYSLDHTVVPQPLIREHGVCMEIGVVVDKLNMLSEERNQFQFQYNMEVLKRQSLEKENEQLKNSVDILDKVRNELIDENEQLKEVLGSILIEVQREISATNHSSEVKAFVTPNSFDLISDVLKKYGALKDWYE